MVVQSRNDTSAWIKQTIKGGYYFPHEVFSCDFDSDGDMDVLSASELDDKIARYENQGVVGIEDKPNKIPLAFSLSKNYPNPFNPNTTIKYGIPRRMFVEFRIYDILGREVKSLVNEEQELRYCEINFNAARLASGVYFYQLKAGSFIQTKKMVLMK